jgi:TolB-like protein
LRAFPALLALMLCAIAAKADDRIRVALLPVVVHASEDREFLQRGLADMLVSRLGREERIAVVPVEDPKLATIDLDAARKTGAANDAQFVVFGKFTRFGTGASLELVCAAVGDAEREPRLVSTHAKSMAELIPLLDGLAQRVGVVVLDGAPGGAAASTPPSDTEAEPVR